MVEIFRTNVMLAADAEHLLNELQRCFPDMELNFDLDDCDRILRVAGGRVDPASVMKVVKETGFHCEILE